MRATAPYGPNSVPGLKPLKAARKEMAALMNDGIDDCGRQYGNDGEYDD